jgi:hypothetical protein
LSVVKCASGAVAISWRIDSAIFIVFLLLESGYDGLR